MEKKRLLITGVSGLLGTNLAYCLRDTYEIMGLYHSQKVLVRGIKTEPVDLRRDIDLESVLGAWRPDVVIHAAAKADVDTCEENPREAEELNILATANLVASLRNVPAKFIYISTDLVYAGDQGHFSEEYPVGPRNVYARTKLEGEREAQKRGGTLILRTNFFGWGIVGKRSLAEWVIEELSAGRSINGFTDAVFSSIYAFDMANLVDRMIRKGLTGIYNMGSRTSMSKYQFLVRVAEALGLNAGLIRAASLDSMPLRAQRSKNLSLDMGKLEEAIGRKVPSMEESIEHFVQDYRRGCREDMRRCITKAS